MQIIHPVQIPTLLKQVSRLIASYVGKVFSETQPILYIHGGMEEKDEATFFSSNPKKNSRESDKQDNSKVL